MSSWRVVAWVTVVVATFAWGVALPHGLFSGDEGVKLAEIQGLDHTSYADGALFYRGAASDPDNALHPLTFPGFTYAANGRIYGTYTLVYPALAVPIYRAGGFAWVWLLSFAGLALMLGATSRIAMRTTGSDRFAALAVLVVGFATSVSLYGCTLCEHTLAGGCLLSAIAVLFGPVTARRACCVGALFAFAVALRTELTAFGPSLLLLCVWRFGWRRAAVGSFAGVALGAAIVLALFVAFNLRLGGVWHPSLVASAQASPGSLADRIYHLVTPLLGDRVGQAALWATVVLAASARAVRDPRIATALGGLIAALWIALVAWAIATMGARPVVGVLTTAPVVVLALGWRPAASRGTTALVLAGGLFVAILVGLPKRGAIGGLELGARYLIPIIPLFVIGALDAARASRVRIACAVLLALAGAAALVANARTQWAIRQLGANIVAVADQADADVVTSDVWWVAQLAIPAQSAHIVVQHPDAPDVWRRLYADGHRRVLTLRGSAPNVGPGLMLRALPCPCLADHRLDPALFELAPAGRVARRHGGR